jgi:hypothetical protein
LGAGIAGAVASSGIFEHIPDAYKDSRFDQDVDRKTGKRTRNILCAPLISSHGATLGVVQVLNKHGGRSFTDEDIELIQAFASQASCSLENLQMFRHIHKLQEYANSVAPTSNSLAMTINMQGHAMHTSTNPLYVLGISIEEMRSTSFPHWLGGVGSVNVVPTASGGNSTKDGGGGAADAVAVAAAAAEKIMDKDDGKNGRVGARGGGLSRNAGLAAAMSQILGYTCEPGKLHRPRTATYHNYSFVTPVGAQILMNITLTPMLTNGLSVVS